MSRNKAVVGFGVKFRTAGPDRTSEKHMKSITTSAYIKAAGLAASVPMIVMIVGAGRKF